MSRDFCARCGRVGCNYDSVCDKVTADNAVDVMEERDTALEEVRLLRNSMGKALARIALLETEVRQLREGLPDGVHEEDMRYQCERGRCVCRFGEFNERLRVALDSTILSAQPVESELKPCLFCGVDVAEIDLPYVRSSVGVTCTNCGARGKEERVNVSDEAATALLVTRHRDERV